MDFGGEATGEPQKGRAAFVGVFALAGAVSGPGSPGLAVTLWIPQDTQLEGFSRQEALKTLSLSGAKSDYLMAWKSMDF